MHRLSAHILLLLLLLGGCASTRPVGYYSTYEVRGTPEGLSASGAEEAHVAAVNAGVFAAASTRFDHPLKLLSAPQPVMPPADSEARVVGRVVVAMFFNEDGLIEKTEIVSSTKDSLSEAVIAAVSRWRISPALRQGVPAKVVVRQSFAFKTQW
jgi:TonB family protein